MRKHSFALAILTVVAGLLFLSAGLNAQVTSNDPNFSPAVLAKNLSAPNGLGFRASNADLAVAQTGANQLSLVKASSGATTGFASQTSPYEVATGPGGIVAVTMRSSDRMTDQVNVYSATGSLLGSITTGSFGLTTINCMSGVAFDPSGNLFVAASANSAGCFSWKLYEFAGPSAWLATGAPILASFGDDSIDGLAFNPVPAPNGSLYAVSSNSGNVYQVIVVTDCSECGGASLVGNAPGALSLSSVAIDPLLGDVYFSGGNHIFVIPPPPQNLLGPQTASVFATGPDGGAFSGVSFDSSGNLYVNDTASGNLWKFSRNAFATAIVPILQGQTMIFTNPNGAMSDQVQKIFIPQSAILNGAASISIVFVPTSPTQLNLRLGNGSLGDSSFFGGGPIPPSSTCLTVPSANGQCLVTVQKCYDANGNEQPICTVQEPFGSLDLIQLTSSFTDPSNPSGQHFAIDFDTPSTNTATDITTQPLDCCSGSGGTKSLCSQTYFFEPGSSSLADFSIGPILPITAGSGSSAVPVTSIDGFASIVALRVSNAPPGITATLNQLTVTPTANTTDNSTTLTVTAGSGFDSATTTANIANVIANLLASGCIDNGGTANALTSKLGSAQAAINSGHIQTAVNTLTAFKSQVQAESGKHIGTSCSAKFTLIVNGLAGGVTHSASVNVTVTGLNAASLLSADATSLIQQLSLVTNGDPITGFVLNGGVGLAGANVAIFNGVTQVATASSDSTGFYYFPNTNILTNGTTYTIQVILPAVGFNNSAPASSTFTWNGKGQAFSFTVF